EGHSRIASAIHAARLSAVSSSWANATVGRIAINKPTDGKYSTTKPRHYDSLVATHFTASGRPPQDLIPSLVHQLYRPCYSACRPARVGAARTARGNSWG